MRILLLSVDSEKSKGGIAEWTRQYKFACQQSDLKCDVIDTSAIGKIAIKITAKRNLIDEFKRYRRIRADIKRKLDDHKYDVVHFNTNIGFLGIIRDYYLAKLIRRYRVPIVLHFHCDIPFWDKNLLVHYYIRRILNITNNALVLNTNSQTYLKEQFQTTSIVIPNFINDDLIVREKIISDQIRLCVFVGRVSFLKGIRELYNVANAFPNIKFLLVGEISEESKSLVVPSNIDLVGIKSHKDVIEFYDNADIFILPSYTEGFSIALLEAMARGVPSIVSDVGSNANMIENKGGIIVPPREVELLVEAVHNIESSDVRKKMAQWNIQKARKSYSSSQFIKSVERIYRESID